MADWLSRYAREDPAANTMTMQEDFTLSSYNSPLPQSLPDTYQPEMIEELFESLDLDSKDQLVIVLTGCTSTAPRGIMKAITTKFPYVINLYKGRVPDGEGKPFCTEPTRDRLGTHKVFKGAGPPVIVVFNNTFDLTSKDRKEELCAFNLIAPKDLVEEVKGDNPIQRHFYAQVGLEILLE